MSAAGGVAADVGRGDVRARAGVPTSAAAGAALGAPLGAGGGTSRRVREGAGDAEAHALLAAFVERHGAATGLTRRALRARLDLPPAPYPLAHVPGLRYALAGVGIAAGLAPRELRWLLDGTAPPGGARCG